MPELFIISKNQLLIEMLISEGYQCSWYNDSLHLLNQEIVQGNLLLFDSTTYGLGFTFYSNFFNQDTIILGTYEEPVFVKSLINHYVRGYLLIEDFISELPQAISNILKGNTFITQQLSNQIDQPILSINHENPF